MAVFRQPSQEAVSRLLGIALNVGRERHVFIDYNLDGRRKVYINSWLRYFCAAPLTSLNELYSPLGGNMASVT